MGSRKGCDPIKGQWIQFLAADFDFCSEHNCSCALKQRMEYSCIDIHSTSSTAMSQTAVVQSAISSICLMLEADACLIG